MAPVDGYDSGSGMCVFPEERVGGRCKKRIDGVCRRSYGGGISMVVADTFDGVLGFFRGVAGDTDDCRFFSGDIFFFFVLTISHHISTLTAVNRRARKADCRKHRNLRLP